MNLPIGLCAQLACIWEATARKPGNVHRFCDFDDLSYIDFLTSAAAIAPVLEQASGQRVGTTVLEAVRATRQVVGTNANLGILLLLAPLAAVPREEALRPGVERVLAGLDLADSVDVFEAIRLAQPGGLGTADEQDVRDAPTLPLRPIMALAAKRDSIAEQYANGFAEVFDIGVPALSTALADGACLEDAIVRTHLVLLSRLPDSLIARKRGQDEAELASAMAKQALEVGPEAIARFDAWLREEGHRRNPGTTADLIAATLFVALREEMIQAATARFFSASRL